MRRVAPAAAVLLLICTCSRPLEPLPVISTVPEFTLTSEQGTQFRSAERLSGRVWIADFIYTTCTGPCPRMSQQMKRVQDGLADRGAIRFVSFTVDPARDTPETLAVYAKRYGANAERWTFLTGERSVLHSLSREAFLLGDVDGSLNHSTRFVLVDRQGRMRGFYGSAEPDVVKTLIRDARRLDTEPS
jgi:protein SCO1/2